MRAMVIGLGTDLVEVGRILDSVDRFGERFLLRVFTERERRYCAAKRHSEQNLAARFAAKEAGAKALGTGISHGVGWQDLEVAREGNQAPRLLLHGRAADLARQLGVTHVSLSLSHTGLSAMAVVVLESGGGERPSG